MLFAIVGTLLNHTIVDYRWIAGGLVLGVVIGYPMGQWVPMTAMPQRIALALTFSALAATLVGVAEYHSAIVAGELPARTTMLALGFEVMLGSITVGGTIIAAGKLQEWITSQAGDVPRPELRERRGFPRHRRAGRRTRSSIPSTGVGVLHDDRRVGRLRHHARDADRRRGHAGRRRAAQLVFAASRRARPASRSATSS